MSDNGLDLVGPVKVYNHFGKLDLFKVILKVSAKIPINYLIFSRTLQETWSSQKCWTRSNDPWLVYKGSLDDELNTRKIVSTEDFGAFAACKYTSDHVAWFCKNTIIDIADGSGFPIPNTANILQSSEEQFHWIYQPKGRKKFAKLPVDFNGIQCEISPEMTSWESFQRWVHNVSLPNLLKFYNYQVYTALKSMAESFSKRYFAAGRPTCYRKDFQPNRNSNA